MASMCPNCRKPFTHVVLEMVTINGPVGYQRAGVSFNCPICSTTLGVQLDPFGTSPDTVAEIGGK